MPTAYVPADNDCVATRRTLLVAVVIHQPPPINPSLAGFPRVRLSARRGSQTGVRRFDHVEP